MISTLKWLDTDSHRFVVQMIGAVEAPYLILVFLSITFRNRVPFMHSGLHKAATKM